MEFLVTSRDAQELLRRTGNKNQKIQQAIRYKNAEQRTTYDESIFSAEELKTLVKVIDDRLEAVPTDRDSKWLRGRLRQYFELMEGRITASRVHKMTLVTATIRNSKMPSWSKLR